MTIVRAREGHAMEVIPTASGRRWQLLCSCGYGRPTTRATEREAIKQGVWHLQQLEAEERRREKVDGLDRRPSTTQSHAAARTA